MRSRLVEQLPAPDYASKISVHFIDLLGQRALAYTDTSWKRPGMTGVPLTLDACLDYLWYTTSIQKLTLRFFYFCIPFFFALLRVQPEEIVSVEMSNNKDGNINFWRAWFLRASVKDFYFAL